MQIGDIGLAGADTVVGVAEEGFGFGLQGGDVAHREGVETEGFVFDVVFEVEVVLLGEGVRSITRREAREERGKVLTTE